MPSPVLDAVRRHLKREAEVRRYEAADEAYADACRWTDRVDPAVAARRELQTIYPNTGNAWHAGNNLSQLALLDVMADLLH